jgi:hypothetical protein
MTRAFDALCALTVMLVTFVTLNVFRMPGGLQEFLTLRLTVKNFIVALLLLFIWHSSFAAFGLYQATRVRSFQSAATRIVLACSLASLFVSLFINVSNSGAFNLRVVLLFWLVSVVVELAGRNALATAAALRRAQGEKRSRGVIVGSGQRALKLWRSIEAREFQDWHVGRLRGRDDYAEWRRKSGLNSRFAEQSRGRALARPGRSAAHRAAGEVAVRGDSNTRWPSASASASRRIIPPTSSRPRAPGVRSTPTTTCRRCGSSTLPTTIGC